MAKTGNTRAEPLYLTLLRALIYSISTVLILFGLSLWPGVLGGCFAVFCGVFLARALRKRRVRFGAVLTLSAGSIFAGVLARWLLTGPEMASLFLGATGALLLTDLVSFTLLSLGLSLGLRATAERFPSMAVLEVGATTGVVVYLLAGHRDLVISEPRLLSDWVWSVGGDPIFVLMGLGALTLATVPLLFLVKQRATKAAFSISALAFLCLMVFMLLQVSPPEPPPPQGGLGLQGKGRTGNPQEGQGGSGNPHDAEGKSNGKDDPSEMPFESQSDQSKPSPVAVVVLEDDYKAPGGYYYFRQTSFSQFNGYRLVRSFARDTDQDLFARFPSSTLASKAPAPQEEEFFQPVESSVALITEHKQPFGLLQPREITAIENPNPDYFRRAYKVHSLAPVAEYRAMIEIPAGEAEWTEAQNLHYTTYPNDPRYEELADKIVSELADEYKNSPMAQALAIRRWLEKNTTYTLRSNHADTDEPTASFLFGNKRGYCVHLAHAQTFLMRARGIPSRVSAGYAIDESRRGNGSSILIQNRDAHAWAELYLDDVGWVVMDVSPENAESEGPPQVNPDLQRELGEMLRDPKEKKEKKPRRDLDLLRYAGLVAGPLLGFLLALLYFVKLWRRWVYLIAPASSQHRVVYRATLDRLAEVGERRDYGETRESFAHRLHARVPGFQKLTSAHVGAAMGSASAQNADRETWRGLQGETRTEINKAYPLWRRFAGLLNPLSWIRVH